MYFSIKPTEESLEKTLKSARSFEHALDETAEALELGVSWSACRRILLEEGCPSARPLKRILDAGVDASPQSEVEALCRFAGSLNAVLARSRAGIKKEVFSALCELSERLSAEQEFKAVCEAAFLEVRQAAATAGVKSVSPLLTLTAAGIVLDKIDAVVNGEDPYVVEHYADLEGEKLESVEYLGDDEFSPDSYKGTLLFNFGGRRLIVGQPSINPVRTNPHALKGVVGRPLDFFSRFIGRILARAEFSLESCVDGRAAVFELAFADGGAISIAEMQDFSRQSVELLEVSRIHPFGSKEFVDSIRRFGRMAGGSDPLKGLHLFRRGCAFDKESALEACSALAVYNSPGILGFFRVLDEEGFDCSKDEFLLDAARMLISFPAQRGYIVEASCYKTIMDSIVSIIREGLPLFTANCADWTKILLEEAGRQAAAASPRREESALAAAAFASMKSLEVLLARIAAKYSSE